MLTKNQFEEAYVKETNQELLLSLVKTSIYFKLETDMTPICLDSRNNDDVRKLAASNLTTEQKVIVFEVEKCAPVVEGILETLDIDSVTPWLNENDLTKHDLAKRLLLKKGFEALGSQDFTSTESIVGTLKDQEKKIEQLRGDLDKNVEPIVGEL